MKRHILTIEDLYSFFEKQNISQNFSANSSGYQLSVSSLGKFEVENNDSEGLLYAKVKAFHDLMNANHSYIDTEVFKSRLSTMKDRPIMADIVTVQDSDGNDVKDFAGHTMEVDENTNKIVYIEHPVGHFINPENFQVEYDEEHDRSFALADCVVYEAYSDACDILRRRQTVDCSIELCIRDMSYDAEKHELKLNDYYVQGLTLLGESVKPGMKGSHVTLADFSQENNGINYTDDIKKEIEELREKIEKIEIYQKGGNEKLMDKFNELLQKYGKTAEDITFEYENLSDEELEKAFSEAFDVPSSDEEFEAEAEAESENENAEQEEETETESVEADVEEHEEEAKFSKVFELSHEDIRSALYHLLESTEETDNDWYFITNVYDDHFAYEGMFTEAIYGQNYTKNGDEVAFDGERYVLHKELLTDSEYEQLKQMRANYSEISEKLAKYEEAESIADKMTVFDDPSFVQFLDSKEFKELMDEENVKKYSKEELSDKANLAFSKLVKESGSFSLKEDAAEEPKSKRDMFAFAIRESKTDFLDKVLKEVR